MGDTLEGDTGGGALSNNTSGICMYMCVCKVVEERKKEHLYIRRIVQAGGCNMHTRVLSGNLLSNGA